MSDLKKKLLPRFISQIFIKKGPNRKKNPATARRRDLGFCLGLAGRS
jgi:hypothetical protein